MTNPRNVTVILVRGLLGFIYSRGMDTLGSTLQRAGYNVQVWNHSFLFLAWFANTGRIASEILRLISTGQKVVLIGHSFGANTILMAARSITASIPLLCAIDPAAQYDCSVARGVKRALGFRQNGNMIGRGQLQPVGDPRIADILTKDSHVYIDDDPDVHNRIIAELTQI